MRAIPLLSFMFALVSVLAGCVAPASKTGLAALNQMTPGGVPTFTSSQVSPGGFEPRMAVGPNDTRWVSTQSPSRTEVVYRSPDGLTWNKTPADPVVNGPCCDNEITVTPSGRVLTSIIGGTLGTTNLDVQWSDDGGKTWTPSKGNALADQDRQWLAVGPKDPSTGQYVVYMLWHNLLSGTADHEMFVSTSKDGGKTFGAPIPVTPPGSPAWVDLQCADSGGPSNIFTNAKTGQVYAVFGTRSSPAGGCGASVTGPFEINVVAATRVWVATSKDEGMTWTDSLAVDDSSAGNIVGMQVNSGTIDDMGNVYVTYPESPKPYPDYDGAAVKYVWAAGDLAHWSKPTTIEPAIGGGAQPGTGHILAHMAAGDPGKLAFFYLTGDGNGTKALWYPTVAVTYDGMDAMPNFTYMRVSPIPAWQGTASGLMGVCNPLGPQPFPVSDVNAALNGVRCPRSSDVLGQAIDSTCHPMFVWYDDTHLDQKLGGTYVTEETGGPTLCSGNETVASHTPPSPAS
ncbi:MAG: sialidase family protein [Thermoplasmatota archaeon]